MMKKKSAITETKPSLSKRLKEVREVQCLVNDICASYPTYLKKFNIVFDSFQDTLVKESEKGLKIESVEKKDIIDSPANSSRYVKGNKGFAGFYHVSIATAVKLVKSGRFNEAKIQTGPRSYIWDTVKLAEIARVG